MNVWAIFLPMTPKCWDSSHGLPTMSRLVTVAVHCLSLSFFSPVSQVESLIWSIFKNEIWCRVQQLRALAALIEDLGSTRSTLIVTHVSVTTVPGILVTSSGLFQHLAHTWCTDSHADKTPMHIEINKN